MLVNCLSVILLCLSGCSLAETDNFCFQFYRREHGCRWKSTAWQHQPQQFPCQAVAFGQQPGQQSHLLEQPRRGHRHWPAALRETDPVSQHCRLWQRRRLQNHQLLELRPSAQFVRLQESRSVREGQPWLQQRRSRLSSFLQPQLQAKPPWTCCQSEETHCR